jgi:hypothetical protein
MPVPLSFIRPLSRWDGDNSNMMSQEILALGIVLMALISLGVKGFRSLLAEPLSNWLLQKGWVKNAVRIRALIPKKSGCTHCKS